MKGIICEEVGRFEFREDMPEPQMREGEAIVRIRRIGICGTDLHAYRGISLILPTRACSATNLPGRSSKSAVTGKGSGQAIRSA